MNLRHRLKRLENEVIDDSEFCRCNGDEQKVEMRLKETEYDCYSSGRYVRYQDSPEAVESDRESKNEKPTIENCQKCGKPINKRLIILNLVG